MAMNRDIFEELFVLEMANNHWGDLNRGLKIIEDFSRIVRFNTVRAAIKLQFRDVDTFIHKDFKDRTDLRYIKKTLATKMSKENYGKLVEEIKKHSCIPMSTAFDERSVELCQEFELPIIKIASCDVNDWFLIEKIAKTKKPVIVSTGGAYLKNIDDMVSFFERRSIPLALNHCVAIYPTTRPDMELNQIEFLKRRYPGHVIGLSEHGREDTLQDTMMIAYAKGARTFEHHIDIDYNNVPVTPYCARPEAIDGWFKAFQKAKELCGGSSQDRKFIRSCETEYLEGMIRGVYAKRDLKKGEKLRVEDLYLAIPLQKGQLTCRELMEGELLINDIAKDKPINIDDIDTPYAYDEELKKKIYMRGL